MNWHKVEQHLRRAGTAILNPPMQFAERGVTITSTTFLDRHQQNREIVGSVLIQIADALREGFEPDPAIVELNEAAKAVLAEIDGAGPEDEGLTASLVSRVRKAVLP